MTMTIVADMAADLAADFDINRLGRAFLDDPYPTYRALREHDPLHRMPDGSYFLTRYDDLVAVYHDTTTWSSDKTVQFRPKFGDSVDFWAANLITSLLFLGVHLPGWIALHLLTFDRQASVFLFGVVMAIAFKYSGSLWAAIVTHSTNDFM